MTATTNPPLHFDHEFRGNTPSKNSDGTTTITDTYNAPTPPSIIENPKLEATAGRNAPINWLGSSFSGADIKAVVHLYGSLSESISPKQERLQERLDFYESLESGAISLLSGLIDPFTTPTQYEARRQVFRDATGLSGTSVGEQRALRELTNLVFNTSSLSTFVGLSSARKKLEQIRIGATAGKEGVQEELQREDKLRDASSSTFTLGTLQTLSVQSHREKFGVRALGHSYVKGYTRGPRTIAGSMIFTVFTDHPLKKLIYAMGEEGVWKDPEIATLLPDQIPPIDVTIVFANEYGALSRMTIYGLEFLNDGATFSIDDLITEQIMNFVARDIDVMTKAGQIRLSKLQRGMGSDRDDSGSSLLFGNSDYDRYLDELKVRRSLSNR